MVRRKAYTKVQRIGFERPEHVGGMGDRPFRVFQCLNPACTNVLVVDERDLSGDFRVECSSCGYVLEMGEAYELCEYQVTDTRTETVVATAPALIWHEDYIKKAARFKYCIVCGALKPLEAFDRHSARASGRQGECNLCKQDYNSVKNGTRLTEQHRIASQQRRLYMQFDDTKGLDIDAILKRFSGSCFKCGQPVSLEGVENEDGLKANLDHTRPVYYLWPLTTNNATLLCREHNGNKRHAWPGEFYTDEECRELSVLTGIAYADLIGPPKFNPEAIIRLQDGDFVDTLFEKFAKYPDELLKLRNRVLASEGLDFLESSKKLSPDWRVRADEMKKT